MSRKIFAVGDIHGCYDKLVAMMKILPWDKDNGDVLLFIGDYVDRGPQSRDVVEFLVRLKRKGGTTIFLKGIGYSFRSALSSFSVVSSRSSES